MQWPILWQQLDTLDPEGLLMIWAVLMSSERVKKLFLNLQIFAWSELHWWALTEWNSCCRKIIKRNRRKGRKSSCTAGVLSCTCVFLVITSSTATASTSFLAKTSGWCFPFSYWHFYGVWSKCLTIKPIYSCLTGFCIFVCHGTFTLEL